MNAQTNSFKSLVDQKLVRSGEKDKVKEMLRTRLVECGWRDELKALCKEVIQSKGLEHITVEQLVLEITPKGRAMVPDTVRAEVLQKIRKVLSDA
ncbi:enhancer of yellow 2 transcription factor [Rhizoclosmatium globosum]|uniref:Transcription and mRNA export factor SUS1 n=1 Tax=Rhizoclosmatium globosum TaxID=329046 RepID=A0A1Y2BGE2_9FUNG|nr:enhancer of yellow 2 transcription factor [Rhizoclosmatium globosum]|eukprot:ORY33557.1 enhancer of yellow 2 transcription factor [Rhizoclosmatium globosum]